MATGGTIPSNRTQSVTFYNTTGVIERHKNMYFVPRFSKTSATANQDVRTAYLNAFRTVCPPSSAYSDIVISTWTPQDRTLVVKGDIDDFRLITDEGACLNYFIITRSVTKGSTTLTHYYGFFITGVQQSGGSSITISCEPDDFTNVFYLHNTHVLTLQEINGDYEPFNEKMKNCYVNRQHYNRVGDVIFFNIYTFNFYNGDVQFYQALEVGDTLTFAKSTDPTTPIGTFTVLSLKGIPNEELLLLDNNQAEKTNLSPIIMTYCRLANITKGIGYEGAMVSLFRRNDNESYETFSPANKRIFLNQKESYKYKYQYRDMKYPICSYTDLSNFTDEEKQSIEETNTFSNLEESLRTKVLLTCLSFLVVETKSMEKIGKVENSSTNFSVVIHYTRGDSIKNLYMPNVRVAFPDLNPPKIFSKYQSELSQYLFYFQTIDAYSYGGTAKLHSAQEWLSAMTTSSIEDFIYSMYYVKDIGLSSSNIRIDYVNRRIYFYAKLPIARPTSNLTVDNGFKDVCVVPLTFKTTPSYDTAVVVHWTQDNTIGGILYRTDDYCFGISFNNLNKELHLQFDEALLSSDIKNDYFDPVLEAEPYRFYSIYELPFTKNRYIDSLNAQGNYTVKINYFISINGAIKVGYIPSYTIEGFENKYFNEGLVFTLSSSLPMTSDSYDTYYYQNKAQMKNQFAVNDYNRGVDLAQHFFISGPNAVGYTASKRGGWGALAETGNQVMQMLDEGIDWAQSNKVIEMNQESTLADMGARPDTIKQAGSDVTYDIMTEELNLYINHYNIDKLSYNSICKLLERVGYQVDLYDTLHTVDRVGWNYIKLNGFDYEATITVAQEDSIRKIFTEGVTLLHDKTYLTSGHNYETILE